MWANYTLGCLCKIMISVILPLSFHSSESRKCICATSRVAAYRCEFAGAAIKMKAQHDTVPIPI